MNTAKLFSLENKVALITGSSRGIGAAMARGFADAGARVWIHGLEEDLGRALAAEVGGRFVGGDLSNSDDIKAIAATLTASEDRLDILVNNAGIFVSMSIEQLDMAVYDRALQINLRAPVELTGRLLPLLKRSRCASIINLTSIHDTVPHPNDIPYCISKAGLAMFTKSASLELAAHNIRINNLAPGAVETDINRAILDTVGRDKFRERIPFDVAQVEQLVGPAVFLASEASSYLTGTTLYADGGYLQNLVRYSI
jgi:glucose 1-dehydrogenase